MTIVVWPDPEEAVSAKPLGQAKRPPYLDGPVRDGSGHHHSIQSEYPGSLSTKSAPSTMSDLIQFLRQSLPEAIGALIAATVLALLGLLFRFFGKRFSREKLERFCSASPVCRWLVHHWRLIAVSMVSLAIGVVIAPARWSPESTTTDVPLARVVRTTSEVRIDGLLDEPVWVESDSLTYAEHPVRNDSTTAIARFLWDDDYLYVGFDVNDTQVETSNLATLWDGDSVSLLLHDHGVVEHRLSIGETSIGNMAVQLKPMTTLNDPSDRDSGYTVEMRIEWREAPSLGKRVSFDLLSVDHDANPGGKYDDPGTVFSKLSWDGDGDITSAGASLLLVD